MESDSNKIALEIRKRTLRSIYNAQSGHLGTSFSQVEILTSLFFNEMNWEEGKEDKFILSKGHGVPSLYAALSVMGHIEDEELDTLRKMGSPLQGHPVAGTVPYIDLSTGSLGQGLSVGAGRAKAIKLRGGDERVYVMIGDGESQEGQIWESAMCASKFKLNNLVGILDHNKYQNEGSIEDTMPLGSLYKKFESFGWYVQEIDGHNFDEIEESLGNCRDYCDGRPSMIVANTIKGKGLKSLEGNRTQHNAVLTKESYASALKELDSTYGGNN